MEGYGDSSWNSNTESAAWPHRDWYEDLGKQEQYSSQPPSYLTVSCLFIPGDPVASLVTGLSVFVFAALY